ncbi:hypothetical protein [Burkholderia cenocepacia]|uniref:hypothetical protein n=1 Tax=Burkholderia cenocepacia TaxID=95486 RepID=UPI002AAFC8D9|nr:hypothetical protein [Burkholderia cenocepacia]
MKEIKSVKDILKGDESIKFDAITSCAAGVGDPAIDTMHTWTLDQEKGLAEAVGGFGHVVLFPYMLDLLLASGDTQEPIGYMGYRYTAKAYVTQSGNRYIVLRQSQGANDGVEILLKEH